MRRILLDMQNNLFADAISGVLSSADAHWIVSKTPNPETTAELCRSLKPETLIMEVTGYPPWMFEERIKLRDTIKQQNSDCKVVLVVDENTQQDVAVKIKNAKKSGLIDFFFYGSVSATYLTALLDSL